MDFTELLGKVKNVSPEEVAIALPLLIKKFIEMKGDIELLIEDLNDVQKILNEVFDDDKVFKSLGK